MTDDEAITRCMLYGAELVYNDYGHPERAGNRMYWRCIGVGVVNYMPDKTILYKIERCGFTAGEAAIKWLQATNRLV